MSPSTLKLLIFIIFLAHGTGHYMGVITAMGFKLSSTSGYRSWLFGRGTVSQVICFVIYLLAFLGFTATAISMQNWLIPEIYWQLLAIISAILSASAILLFWNGLAMGFNRAGALTVDFLTLASILYFRWPTELYF